MQCIQFPLLISSMEGFLWSSPTFRFLVQNLQYIEHSLDANNKTLSGYLCIIVLGPPSGISPSSSRGSSDKVHIMLKFLDIRNCLLPDTVIHLFNETEIIGIYPHRIFGNNVPESGVNLCLSVLVSHFSKILECPYRVF